MIRHEGFAIDRKNNTISFRGNTVQFVNRRRNVAFKIIQHLLLEGPHGADVMELYERTHGDCPNGGTMEGPLDIHVWMVRDHMKRYLALLGLKIVKHRHNSRVRYALRVV